MIQALTIPDLFATLLRAAARREPEHAPRGRLSQQRVRDRFQSSRGHIQFSSLHYAGDNLAVACIPAGAGFNSGTADYHFGLGYWFGLGGFFGGSVGKSL
ncbi:MAG TPA: hypothetical protein VMF50_13660 [Candidatus Binataceae bacterium]|nr:hypothetical protein [Candidatus Binataceae bacterium]